MKKTLSLLLAIFLVLCLSSCAVAGYTHETISDTVELDKDDLRKLDVELTSGELDIHLTDGTPYVEYTIEKGGISVGDPDVKVRQGGGETSIKTQPFTINIGGYCKYDIDIYIPEDVVSELSIEMTSGDTAFSDLSLRELDITMTSGNVNVSNVQASTLELGATSGSADVEGSFDYIDIDVTSGNMDVSSAVLPYDINCELTSGNVDVNIPDDEDGFTLYYDRTSGSIDSSFATTGSSDDRSGVLKYAGGKCEIDVEITSGGFSIGKY